MGRQVVLLRVGVDSGYGGIQGPLFEDGTFEFICIPDRKGVGTATYADLVDRDGRVLIGYFPESRRAKMALQPVHIDPEFDTFTYGDPTPPKRSLRKLTPGDFLVFYCGLQQWGSGNGWNRESRPALYLAGFFEVARAGLASSFPVKVLQAEFANNHHVRHPARFEPEKDRLVLVKGGPGSRLFGKAHRLSDDGQDRTGRPLKILSAEMQKVFGTLGGHLAIQRSPPRWVEPDFVDKAIDYLRGLE